MAKFSFSAVGSLFSDSLLVAPMGLEIEQAEFSRADHERFQRTLPDNLAALKRLLRADSIMQTTHATRH